MSGLVPKIETRQERWAAISQEDIRRDGTLTPQARDFLSRLLPSLVHDYTIQTRPRGDVRIDITFRTEHP